ncbi:hypothetical protein [Stieleria mannarensis]|uniref:hypothetical protein n=1 Tax=Stieleria mannarensis TaxID=2755585 RepID=UPI0015FEC1C6|nr:hypothetical protein [Rhodopirellula sp. JC639]
MRRFHPCLTLAAIVICCCGCEKNPLSGMFGSDDPAGDDGATELVEGADAPSTIAVVSETIGDAQLRKRLGDLFERVLPTLEETRELVDRHADLPDSSVIPFKLDKQSNSAQINELLDQAIVALSVSEVSDYRQRIREANEAIAQARTNIADYRRQRVSASWAKDQSQLDKVNPFELSKEAIDESIDAEEEEIERQTKTLAELKETFAEELSKIGVEVDQEGVESLLSSVSGDDIVTMAVVFDNIKHVTVQLQELTENSGEALDVSKRYYGIYVVMIHVMDRIQKTFVRDVNEKHIPKLNEFAAQAKQNIKQARTLIEVSGGDREVLEANIASNELTRETANLYIEYLKRNAALIEKENKLAQKKLATAMNTYDTVKLSSDVAALMNTGRRDFETLMRLKVPSLREFNNAAIRKEFERMTSELRAGR